MTRNLLGEEVVLRVRLELCFGVMGREGCDRGKLGDGLVYYTGES